uniref:Clp R domain-containing protein n=1 Tax=Chrysotila carterae TaxID=13221 RepID=A0A7S4B772_CHRCT
MMPAPPTAARISPTPARPPHMARRSHVPKTLMASCSSRASMCVLLASIGAAGAVSLTPSSHLVLRLGSSFAVPTTAPHSKGFGDAPDTKIRLAHASAPQRAKVPFFRASSPRMFFDAYDKDAMRLVMDAQSEARKLGGTAVGTEHLLLAAAIQGDDIDRALRRGGLEPSAIRKYLRPDGDGMPRLDRLFAATARDELLPFSKDTELSMRAAVDSNHGGSSLISSKQLVLAVLDEKDVECGAHEMLASLGIDRSMLLEEVRRDERELVGGAPKARKNTTLTQCSIDLTQQAREGKLDPVLGRDEEVRRCLQILVRRRKSNPVLIGDPGVGKTAIAEELARRIVDERVPPRLIGKRLVSLELGLLVADTKYRGEFEQRLKEVIDEVTSNNDTVLFIDEIHTLVGAGAADGAIDAANLLKPALARGTLQCIGATTVAEYRKYIEKDAALERRFQPVTVPESTPTQTVLILQGLQSRYEEHHGVKYSEEAVAAAAKLAERYIPDRFLPDKAIDLMDEAGALRQMAMFDVPDDGAENYDVVTEEDVASVVSQWTGIPVSKLSEDERSSMIGLETRLHTRLIGQHGAVAAVSRALRRARVGLRDPRRPVASLFFSGPTGVGKTELAKAVADAYYGSEKAMIRFDMSEYMESFSVSRLTGPPPGYVGYEAGGQLTEAVRRNPHSLILLDEVEKAHPDVFNVLLQVLEDGRLTDNKGRTVDFSNAMLILTSNIGSRTILQLNQGDTADADAATTAAKVADAAVDPQEASTTTTVTIKRNGVPVDGDKAAPVAQTSLERYSAMRTAVKSELGERFRPEFLNRLDEIIVFAALEREEVQQVATLLLAQLKKRCVEMELELRTTPHMERFIADTGYSPQYGARPLRRAVQRLCEDPIAEAMLDGFTSAGEMLELDYSSSGGVLLRNAQGEERVHEYQEGQGIEDDDSKGSALDAEALRLAAAQGASTATAPKTSL